MSKVMLRTSERNLFKRCQWQWERSYVDRLAPRHERGTALWFGTGIHLALEKYYVPGTKRGANPADTWNEYVNDTMANVQFINTQHNGDSTFAVEARELGEAMLKSYVDEYGEEEWKDVLAAELSFQINVKYKDVDGENRVGTYVGTMDLVYRDHRDGKIYIEDHKTCKALGSSNTQYLPLDDQAGAYYAVAKTVLRNKGLIGEKEFVSGIVYNYLVKAMPDERPRNAEGLATNKPKKEHFVAALSPEQGSESDLKKMTIAKLEELAEANGIEVFGEVSKQQPTKRFERVVVRKNARQQNNQIRRISEDLSAMSIVRDGVVPATKTPTRECGFCPFVEICETDEKGLDYSDLADQIFTKWNPYEAHEEALDD